MAGRLAGDALLKDSAAAVTEVMELGPRTTRPSRPIEELLAKQSSYGVKTWIVTISHGVYQGVLTRDEAEAALERYRAEAEKA